MKPFEPFLFQGLELFEHLRSLWPAGHRATAAAEDVITLRVVSPWSATMTSFILDDRRAIVLGASIAGLLTARVLCGRFAEVVLLERDELPARPAPRIRTPHAVHRMACWSADARSWRRSSLDSATRCSSGLACSGSRAPLMLTRPSSTASIVSPGL
jgi:hypothetical protein